MKKAFLFLFFFIIYWSAISQMKLNEKYNLMPWPKTIEENNSRYIINSDLTISILGNDQGRARKAAISFLRRLSGRTGIFIDAGFPLNRSSASIEISFDKVSDLSLESDESYTLEIQNKKVTIKAITDVGAIRALETLLQSVNNGENDYYFPGLVINDSPRFVWRGLMIDVARHFQPIDVLKRNLDAMASVKMNVFHWHLTDDQGFRIKSKVYPKLHELASDGLFYTHEQIREIVNHASDLGIRVVPEFDVPGHATAILTAYPEIGSKPGVTYTIERNSGIFDPTLDPTNDKTYEFLKNLFAEMAPLFPDPYFHIGGDENEGKHWDENKEIQNFKKKNNLKTNHDLQTYFNIKLEKILNDLDKNLMGWDEIMTPNMPTSAVIHSWRGENEGLAKGGTLIKAAKTGYKTVLSNGFYIDRMLSVEHHYSNEPIGDIDLTEIERARILGGEATMWSELVTPLTIDSRIWPRTAAIAERLWSSRGVNDIDNMLYRLKDVNYKLEELGITHIRNRDVILRNLSNNQNIDALRTLSKVCEPLKMYSRNEGGTEYKTYSPFTLFADACVADAEDAVSFKRLVSSFLAKPDNTLLDQIKNELEKWAMNHEQLMLLTNNPKVKPLIPLSQNLSKTSNLLVSVLNNKRITKKDYYLLNIYTEALKEPYADVEVAVVIPLQQLTMYCKENF